MAQTLAQPLSALRQAAVAMHEQFTELTGVGFTESQAIKIIVGLATAHKDDEGPHHG